MNITVIKKPAPHCPIPLGHRLYRGYTPAEKTDIRKTFARCGEFDMLDDYDLTTRTDYLEVVGRFAR